MKYFGEGLGEQHNELGRFIRKKDRHEDSVLAFLALHEKLHLSKMSNGEPNEIDTLLNDMSPQEYHIMPTAKDETIAWSLWHITRIEDLTMSILIACSAQLFDYQWKLKMNASIYDTGNALSDDEIMQLSRELNIVELLAYRNAVGKRTREIVNDLATGDMKRKVSASSLDRIKLEGGVTEHKDSVWLLDYWGKKDVAGLLLMPPTRHLIMHLNDCSKWKQQIRTKQKYFRVE